MLTLDEFPVLPFIYDPHPMVWYSKMLVFVYWCLESRLSVLFEQADNTNFVFVMCNAHKIQNVSTSFSPKSVEWKSWMEFSSWRHITLFVSVTSISLENWRNTFAIYVYIPHSLFFPLPLLSSMLSHFLLALSAITAYIT